jgi:hypothetical protein
MSKNKLTLEHLQLACRHVDELIAAGVTEDLAIRTLELFSDVYAKLLTGGSATPHHVDDVDLWSVQAIKARSAMPKLKPKDHLRVEHGRGGRPAHKVARCKMSATPEERWGAAGIAFPAQARSLKAGPRCELAPARLAAGPGARALPAISGRSS